MKVHKLYFVIVSLLLMVGCTRDPATELHKAVMHLDKRYNGNPPDSTFEADSIEWDAKKTDSIKSPFEGTVKYRLVRRHPDPEHELDWASVEIRLTYQDGHWVVYACEKKTYSVSTETGGEIMKPNEVMEVLGLNK
jgi:hypothetical protein